MALKGTVESFYTYKQDDKVDFSLPQGMGGKVSVCATYKPSEGVKLSTPQPFIVYKEADREAPVDYFIKGIVQGANVTYRPHQPLVMRETEALVNFRPHKDLQLRRVTPFCTERKEDGVDSYRIPYGIGGKVLPFITLKIHKLVGYVNDIDIVSVSHIALENDAYPIKAVQSINDIPVDNNNTADNKGG